MSREPITWRAAQAVKRGLNRAGISLSRYSNTLEGARRELLASGTVGLVIDVGAHAGEYGSSLRRSGYRGRIASFEPIASHFARLSAAASADPAWTCVKAGLGAEAGEAEINVSGNDGYSSSILPMEETHERALESSAYASVDSIRLETLDGMSERIGPVEGAYLKIDTQGYELEVVRGGESTVPACTAIELELSTVPLYTGQPLIGEMIAELSARGFALHHLEPEFTDPSTGELLQVNGLFRRRDPR